MRNWGWLLVVGTMGAPSSAQSVDGTPAPERAVLDHALVLSGLSSTHLPVALIDVFPNMGSPGAEAWTVYDESGNGDRIFVYTGGRTFQCASARHAVEYQCLLRLASIIVHEAWHLKNGPDEAAAYDAQVLFLESQRASDLHILDIRRSRSRVLAEKRNAGKRARRYDD